MDTQLNLSPDDDILYTASPKLVSFTGRAGSGKSVCAKTLIDMGYKRVKFADGLKDMLRALYSRAGLKPEEIERRIEGDLKEQPDPVLCGSTPRWAMQSLGQEWGRDSIASGLWVSIWTQAVLYQMSQGFNVVTDDVRYQNEYEAVQRLGGTVTIVTRPDTELVDVTHPSERLLFEPDNHLLNDGSIEALINEAQAIAV